jgi:hypothetical protein
MPKAPCAVVSVDLQDVMGSHEMDVGGGGDLDDGQLHKSRVDADGNLKFDQDGNALPIDDFKSQKGEGCNVHGHMLVKRVPGNFHVSAHAHANLLGHFFGGSAFDTSHVIHELSFGDPDAARALSTVDTTVTNPLEGALKETNFQTAANAPSFEYYIKIVPTNYKKLGGQTFESFQFSANSNENVGRYRIPAVYFRYDMSPITVTFEDKKEHFSHFLVQICAIIGGVFTVVGLVNSLFITTLASFKRNIGKLG